MSVKCKRLKHEEFTFNWAHQDFFKFESQNDVWALCRDTNNPLYCMNFSSLTLTSSLRKKKQKTKKHFPLWCRIEAWFPLLFSEAACGSRIRYSSESFSSTWPTTVPKVAQSHKDESTKINLNSKWKPSSIAEIASPGSSPCEPSSTSYQAEETLESLGIK